MDLKGKNALITGAAKRLGREIALSLAERGVNVAVHYNRSGREAEGLVGIISNSGRRSVALQGNIEKTGEIKNVVERASASLGGLDILVNNAAIFYQTDISEVRDEDWNRFININLRAQFYFAREFALLKHTKTAKIINMSDGYAFSPAAAFIPYGVSKAGVVAMTKGLAKAYAPDILVNCICPGPILPPDGIDKESQARAVRATLLKREGTTEDITKTVVFLSENDYITGQAIFVDGGRNVNVHGH